MGKIRFAIIGAGWRACFFVRIAKALPEQFEIVGVWARDADKANAFAKEHGVTTYTDLDKMLTLSFDFVITSLTRGGPLFEYNKKLMEAGIPILSETPPASDIQGLNELWEYYTKYNAKIQVAEQCFEQPMIKSMLNTVNSGLIGEVSNVNFSFCHGYHGVNLIRRFLGIGHEKVKVWGKRFHFDIQNTMARSGEIIDGSISKKEREYAFLEFDNGKVALYDFGGVQYHSWIRAKKIQIQGVKGEIMDHTVRFMVDDSTPAQLDYLRFDLGLNGDIHGYYNKSIMLGDRVMFQNPFAPARLNDDEIAIAQCLVYMAEYLKTGKSFYDFRDALQDTYISLLIKDALDNDKSMTSEPQSWT